MKYIVNVENKDYVINVKRTEREMDVDDIMDKIVSEDTSNICLEAVIAEYEHETLRTNKIDNKVYI